VRVCVCVRARVCVCVWCIHVRHPAEKPYTLNPKRFDVGSLQLETTMLYSADRAGQRWV